MNLLKSLEYLQDDVQVKMQERVVHACRTAVVHHDQYDVHLCHDHYHNKNHTEAASIVATTVVYGDRGEVNL